VETGIRVYELQLVPSAAQLESLASRFQSDEDIGEIWKPEILDDLAASLRTQDVADRYDAYADLVARFVTVEMDTVTPGKSGLGRISPSDPPPRFGAEYRRKLKAGGAYELVAPIVERLVFCGYAAGVMLNSVLADTPQQVVDRNPQEAYRLWLREFAPTYWEMKPTLDPSESAPSAMCWQLAYPDVEEYQAATEQLKIGKGLRKSVVSPEARKNGYVLYFMGVGLALFFAGTDAV
jgi:hypothetical protein